jgi:hypothetical protein
MIRREYSLKRWIRETSREVKVKWQVSQIMEMKQRVILFRGAI